MATQTFTVKVKSGKRTPVEVWVEQWYPEREIVFTNGRTLKNQDIGEWIQKELTKALKSIESMEPSEESV